MTCVGLYNFHDVENADRMAQLTKQNRVQCKTVNLKELAFLGEFLRCFGRCRSLFLLFSGNKSLDRPAF